MLTWAVIFCIFVNIYDASCQSKYIRGGGTIVVPPRSTPPPEMQRLQEVYSWSQVDFQFPTPESRAQALQDGSFVPVNVSVPASIEAAGSRVFVAVPRWLNGTPSTLSTVPYPSSTRSPLLTPYPNLEFNRQGNCDGLTSVYRVKVDECNRLWVLDTGIINAFERAELICPRQVLVFDLNTDEMVYRYRFPEDVVRQDTLFVTIEIDYPDGDCNRPQDAYIYAADSDAFALVVVELSSSRAWRIRDKTMYPSPEAGSFVLLNETFELMDGVFGLALSPRIQSQRDRILYYNAMNGFNQRWASTALLKNESASTSTPTAYNTGSAIRISQAGDTAIDSNGVLFFGLLGEQAMCCWNTRLPYLQQNIATIARDDIALQFPVSVQVDQQNQLWVMSTRFQKFAIGTLPANDTNFRVFVAPTDSIIRGTVCQPRADQTGGPGSGNLAGNSGAQPRPAQQRPLVTTLRPTRNRQPVPSRRT